MHLHGHVFQVVAVNGVEYNGPMRDTVLVGGGCQSVKICFDALNAGVHAFHCHMSFHMAAGLMTTVE
jgi:FtsP/CotA-like multicopper oxidase with cupredoxin domain